MKYHFLLFAVSLISLLGILSCSDEPSSIGIDFLESDFLTVSTFDTKDDSVSQSSSFFKKVVPLGLASKILIGKRDDVEASTLMDFVFSINDSLKQDFLDDKISVNQAFIELTPQYTYSDKTAEIDFTVHKINSKWSINGFTADSLPNLSFDEANLSSNKNFTDSLYTFDLDNDFVLSWIKNSIDSSIGKNEGIYYKPTMTSGKVVGFQALTISSSDAAKLKVVIEKPGKYIDTIRASIFSDVSVVTADLPVLPSGVLGIQSSVTLQSRFLFDLSGVPRDVIINKADLILEEDTLNSVTGSSFDANLKALRITDSTDLSIDEGNEITLTKENYTYTGDITSFITSWIRNEDNQGLVIQTGKLTEGLELIAIKGSDYPDQSVRPRLRIVFTSK